MTVDEALTWVETILDYEALTQVQEIVFRQSWEGKSYSNIAQDTGYDPDYIKDVGAKLWKRLSQELGERVKKDNLKAVLRRYLHRHKVNIQRNLVIEVNLSGADLSGANLTGSRVVANFVENDASKARLQTTPSTYSQDAILRWQNLTCHCSIVATLAEILEARNINFLVSPQFRLTIANSRQSYVFDLLVQYQNKSGLLIVQSKELVLPALSDLERLPGIDLIRIYDQAQCASEPVAAIDQFLEAF